MEITPWLLWNVVLSIVIVPIIWIFRGIIVEMKRIDILLNRTREDYATRTEMRDDMKVVVDALHRVEDKLDRVLSKD
jgi:hypothetical protein|tara:strand:+ start:242 stop:472 length:231 start_codon:yes stop_codon:yes gene_type:complete